MKNITIEKFILATTIILVIIAFFTKDLTITLNTDKLDDIFDTNINNELTAERLKNIENITWNFYYSPTNSWDAFSNSLKSAENLVKIQTYEFTKKEIKQIMKNILDKKWVNIQLIMENNKYQQYQNTWNQVQEYFSAYPRFEIKSDEQMGTMYTHSKIALIDSGFWIQTANLTHSSFFKNREHFFYSENTWVRESLNTIFDKDRNWEKINIDDLHPNLVVCNINCRPVIENLLNNAKNSILIQTQYIVDGSIIEILKNQSIKLKDMRFIVSATDSNNDLLKYFGPWVAKKFDKYYNHTKMILIDDRILLLWSMNLSSTSLDQNREIGIIIIDDQIIKEYKNLFEKDWENSKY